jgi:uncharacterized RDD family membrane protein YckC
MICSSCGNNILPTFKRCPSCGHQNPVDGDQSKQTASPSVEVNTAPTVSSQTTPTSSGQTAPSDVAHSEPSNSNTASQTEYASFWSRVGAYLIDLIILTVIMMIYGFARGVLGAVTSGGDYGTIEFMIVELFLMWSYFSLQEASIRQATVGKRLMGIKVVSTRGDRLSLGKASLRTLGKVISMIIFSLPFIAAAFTEKKQGIHDFFADSIVVRQSASD